ncbi:hypothetical protein [Pseudomonas spelaei]
MKIDQLIIFFMLCVCGVTAHATVLGREEYANIASLNGRPAICLRNDSTASLAVGWVTLSESYSNKMGVWALTLREGASPLILKPGECFSYGMTPAGYEPLVSYGRNEYPLVLEADKTYVFRLNDAYRPTDSRKVVFCIKKTATGAVEYLQYTQLADGSQIVPACDGARNAKVIERHSRGGVDK